MTASSRPRELLGAFMQLGHVLGLAHVEASGELMEPGVCAIGWGPGDLEALRLLGIGRGCLPVPSAPGSHVLEADWCFSGLEGGLEDVGNGLSATDGSGYDSVWTAAGDTLLHFDGESWSVKEVPGADGAVFHDVLVTATDVWAIAERSGATSGEPPRPLVVRWDGIRWTTVSLPGAGELQGALLSGARTGEGDVWVVGRVDDETGASAPLVFLWNGTSWARVPAPELDGGLTDVSASPTGEIWTVGGGSAASRIVRWNGSGWDVSEPPAGVQLRVVLATGESDVWMGGTGPSGAVLLHGDGATWEPVPIGSSDARDIVELASDPEGTLWAVGVGEKGEPLVLEGGAKRWRTRVLDVPEAGSVAVASAAYIGARPQAVGTWEENGRSHPFLASPCG